MARFCFWNVTYAQLAHQRRARRLGRGVATARYSQPPFVQGELMAIVEAAVAGNSTCIANGLALVEACGGASTWFSVSGWPFGSASDG